MDENEMLEAQDDAAEDEADFDGFDDEDDTDEVSAGNDADDGNAESEADQPSEDEAKESDAPDAAEGENDSAASDAPPEQAPAETFELKHYSGNKSVNRDEVIVLAQKGMDYDNIRTERDSARMESERLRDFESFVTEMAANSGSAADAFMDELRTKLLIERERLAGQTISDTAAKEQIQRERAARAAKPKAEEKQAEEKADTAEKPAAATDAFKRFAADYPDVKATEIPSEVWDGFRAGKGELSNLYAKYENARLKAENAALKSKAAAAEKNEKNREKSTGSRKTAGASKKENVFEGWDDE